MPLFICAADYSMNWTLPEVTDSFGNGWDYSLRSIHTLCQYSGGADGQARKTGTISYTEALTLGPCEPTLSSSGFDFRDVGEEWVRRFSSRRQLTLDPSEAFDGFDPGEDVGRSWWRISKSSGKPLTDR